VSSIYFISDGDSIKIGRSKDVTARMKDLSCGSARPLSLIASVNGHSKHESKVHAELADYRLNGEWFADCQEVRSAISRYVESGISVDSIEVETGPETEIVRRCRVAAELLVTRKMNAGLSKMEAYKAVSGEVGLEGQWLRKFIARDRSVKEPRVSVGFALLFAAGFLPDVVGPHIGKDP
jgi:hypothetical protein